jgi:hypothetical protein
MGKNKTLIFLLPTLSFRSVKGESRDHGSIIIDSKRFDGRSATSRKGCPEKGGTKILGGLFDSGA